MTAPNYRLIRLAIIDGEICIGTSYKPTNQGDEKYDQNPTSTSYDPNKDVLVGKPIQVADLKSDKPVALQLSRPVALLKVVPQFDDAAKQLLGDAKITTAQVLTSGPRDICPSKAYSWKTNGYTIEDTSNPFPGSTYVQSSSSLNLGDPIYLFCLPLATSELGQLSKIYFNLKFSNNCTFESERFFLRSMKFHLDAGKVNTLTFNVTGENITQN